MWTEKLDLVSERKTNVAQVFAKMILLSGKKRLTTPFRLVCNNPFTLMRIMIIDLIIV